MFRTIIRRVMKWQRSGHEIARLQSLDDDLLADMGIDREEIPGLVRGKPRRQI